MLQNISIQYPSWYILLCLALGIVYTAILYYRENKFESSPRYAIYGLALLRFLSSSLIAFLLLQPLLKKQKEETKDPKVIILEDKSTSVSYATSKEELLIYNQGIERLNEELGEKYDIIRLNFGSNVSLNPLDSTNSLGSNLAQAIHYLDDNYADQNIGSVILSSDGIYNQGKNPLYQKLRIKAPLNTILLGDTSIRRDISIQNVLHNKIAYLEDKFVIEVQIDAKQCALKNTQLSVSKVNGNKSTRLNSTRLNINSNNEFLTHSFELKAENSGIMHFRINVTEIEGETTLTNNVRDIFVEVLDAKQSILILADAPHPDLSALNQSITNNKNYEVDTRFIGDTKDVIWKDIDLVILHNLPSEHNDLSTIVKNLDRLKTPRLYIAGANTNLFKLNNIQTITKYNGNSNSLEDIQPAINNQFKLFDLSEDLKKFLNAVPPLKSTFGSYNEENLSSPLLYQKIKKIKTNYPLLSFSDISGIKSGVWNAEGIWKWRFYDFQETQSFDRFNTFIGQLIQYLTVKNDKRRFRVNIAKRNFLESENIIFDAQLYNNSFELINEPDVEISIYNQDQKEYPFTFSKISNYYSLNCGKLENGIYTYKASVNFNNERLTSSGQFSISDVQLEQYNLRADKNLLSALSDKYNGKMYDVHSIEDLKEQILRNENMKPIIFTSNSTESLLHWKWMFLIILLLLSIEWFLRRYWGNY